MKCFFFALIPIAFLTCKDSDKKNSEQALEAKIVKTKDSEYIPEKLTFILGYRFSIKGDFDGDGKNEKLVEHYISGIDKKETNKFYFEVNFEQLCILNKRKKPISFLSSTNTQIDTLEITSDDRNLGLSFLKNEGNLDGINGDEISYVIHWADQSNTNTCFIFSLRNKKWKEIYSFPIWDWQIPDLPGITNEYCLWGLKEKTSEAITPQSKAIFNQFEGLIKKKRKKEISITYVNHEESKVDTKVVKLR